MLPVRFALLDLLVQLVPPAQRGILIMEEFVILALLQSTISVNHVLLRILVQYAQLDIRMLFVLLVPWGIISAVGYAQVVLQQLAQSVEPVLSEQPAQYALQAIQEQAALHVLSAITQAQDQEPPWFAQHVVLSTLTVKDAPVFQLAPYAQLVSLEVFAIHVLLVTQD